MSRGGAFAVVPLNDPPPEAPPPRLSASQKVGVGLAIVADAAILLLVYLHNYNFDLNKLIDRDVKSFTPETLGRSMIDVFCLLVVRVILAIICAACHRVVDVGHPLLLFCVWLSIAKLIVVSYWKNADLVVAVLCSFGFSLLYWRLTKFPARMQTPEEKLKRKALLRSVFRILKPYFWPKGCVPRLRVASTWVFLGISKAANIASPLMVSLAVQQLTAGNGVPYFYIILFTGLTFVSKAAKECQSLVYLKVKQTAFAQVAEFTFVHLHSLSLEWHLKKKMGQVLRAMDRGIAAADNVVQYLCLSLFPTLVECVFTLVIFWAHFKLPILAAVAMLSFAMYCWLTITITLWRKKFREQTNRHDNAYHDKATDSLVNYETVKYFANEDWERKRYVKSISDYQKFTVATQASLSLLNLSQQLVIGLCLCLGLFEASYAVLHGGLPVGDFVAVQIYIAQLFTPLTFLGTIYGMVVQATIDMQNLSDMLTERPDVNDEPGALPIRSRYDSRGVELEFQKVAFHYPEQPPEQGLQEISFVTPAGTTTAIVGHTGAGKTTISRLLFRFYDVTGGRIMIDGQNVASVTQGSLRKLIGMVPQDTVLFNDTIQYNIKYGNLDATFEELESAAASAQILDFIRGLPNGWDTMVGERGLKLSGGEKQRVAIARCLLKDPSLVVLDEATSALDTRTEKEVQTALQCLKGRTTVVIAHRLSTVRSANQIIVLGHGCVLEHGTHDELIQKKGEYYAMCQAQIENGESSPGSSPSSPVPPDPADGTAGAV